MLSHEQIQSTQAGGALRDSALSAETRARARRQLQRLGISGLLLALVFSIPLVAWVKLALHSALSSYLLLIPFVSVYLAWSERHNWMAKISTNFRKAVFPFMAGLLTLGLYSMSVRSGWRPSTADYLAAMMLAFLFLFWSSCFAFLGSAAVRRIAFSIAFLLFMVPLPEVVRGAIESFLQHTSAEVAYLFLKISGMPVFRRDLTFQLPGFSMHVARECSGINSSLILFITGLIASHLFLGRWTSRTIMVAAVIVLGILRNGFRIFVLGQLCVRAGPDMIDSTLHRRGGPIFFLLSLVPLFFLLWYLRKRDRFAAKANAVNPGK